MTPPRPNEPGATVLSAEARKKPPAAKKTAPRKAAAKPVKKPPGKKPPAKKPLAPPDGGGSVGGDDEHQTRLREIPARITAAGFRPGGEGRGVPGPCPERGDGEQYEPGVMPSPEARQRKPKYKENKRVRHAENFATNVLGIKEVDYGGNLIIANHANHAFFLAGERGVPMPSRVVARPFHVHEGDDPREIAYYVHNPGSNAPGEIEINSGHTVWGNLGAVTTAARQRGLISTGDPRHFVMHEMGELAMHQSVGADRFEPREAAYLQNERAFRTINRTAFAQTVSQRAADNHSEFVAEVFTGLTLGRDDLRQNQSVMQAYRRFGGDKIVNWTS